MLLGDELLAETREATAARVWRVRERTEWTARSLFARLADDLEELRAAPRLVEMARQAAADEARHAALCRELIERFGGGADAPDRPPATRLGPDGLPADRRALYASVAVSCVTETLSTALLLEIRRCAGDRAVLGVVREILKDEVDHARIGWAHLAVEAGRGSVAWIAPHLPGMLAAALPAEETPRREPAPDLRELGILPRREVEAVLRRVAHDVIFPGLERFGVDTSGARATVAGP